MHGMGVNVPKAADVAAATTGFTSERHKPNGKMFTMGLLSIIFACGRLLFSTLLTGNTTNDEGAKPMLHFIIAPLQTYSGISVYFNYCCFLLEHATSINRYFATGFLFHLCTTVKAHFAHGFYVHGSLGAYVHIAVRT